MNKLKLPEKIKTSYSRSHLQITKLSHLANQLIDYIKYLEDKIDSK